MAIKVYPVASTNVKYYTTDHISMNNNLIKEKTIFNNGFILFLIKSHSRRFLKIM